MARRVRASSRLQAAHDACRHPVNEPPLSRKPEIFDLFGRRLWAVGRKGLSPSVRLAQCEPACFPECQCLAVLLPESFRGGCSFGAGHHCLRNRAAGLSREAVAACSLIAERVAPSTMAVRPTRFDVQKRLERRARSRLPDDADLATGAFGSGQAGVGRFGGVEVGHDVGRPRGGAPRVHVDVDVDRLG
jgi:hypothetical protein